MFDFLQPISNSLLEFVGNLPEHTLGQNIEFYSLESEPEIKKGSLVLFSVAENRNSIDKPEQKPTFDKVREEFYKLAKGDWTISIYDIGQIEPGETVSDTYFAVQKLVSLLREIDCIPMLLGAGQDIMYAQYKSYDPNKGMVNLVNVDAHFDLGNVDLPITNRSYLGKIIVEQPYNLFNYTNLGYQSYYVAPEELDLLNRMFFEKYRLGDLIGNLSVSEPVMRDADVVGIDCNSISSAYYGDNPNGFSGREICALARYAGISDRVTNFGVYEYNFDISAPSGNQMIAQLLWYFIEGVSSRWNESGELDTMDTLHYQVPIAEDIISFYKSKITERWWMKITYSCKLDNNSISNALLPCTYEDYKEACNQVLPERWYNAKMKLQV